MRALIRCYHFLGSIYFAIVLIGFTALFVIAGTLLESVTQSHLYAAFYTYRNPAFLALLALFFVNILLSTTRRWPFRKAHLPFLATHLGLLMIIAGTAVKHVYGVQGTMQIAEGSGSRTIALSETRAIRIEKRDPDHPTKRLIGQYTLFSGAPPFPELEISIASLHPNSIQSWESWIKGRFCEVAGLDPFPVLSWLPETGDLPLGAKVRFAAEPAPVWDIYAAYTEDFPAAENQLRNQARPCLGIFRNKEGDHLLSAFYLDGSHWTQTYRAHEPGAIFVYDEGFQGYSAFAKLPHATLETPLKAVYRPAPPSKKLEENRSLIALRVKKGGREELISLRYDPQGLELAHPILGGEYLLRYTQQTQEIPARLRLRQARQINYPGTDQPYSFECDVWACGQEKTLSMNNVYETPEGYRFYLANLTPANESAVKRVQLVVNYDPMKYILTYPGGILVSLGILLLWKKSRSAYGK